jgi:hypothetical protein
MPNDDLEHSGSDQSEDNTSVFEEPDEDKDEVGEVRKMSSKDTFRVLMGRYAVTVVLLLTAFAVTFTTYMMLQDQEKENFKTAVSGRMQKLEAKISYSWLLTRSHLVAFQVRTVFPHSG